MQTLSAELAEQRAAAAADMAAALATQKEHASASMAAALAHFEEQKAQLKLTVELHAAQTQAAALEEQR
eukprot:5104586-Pyramimonas_sp.AAC.1